MEKKKKQELLAKLAEKQQKRLPSHTIVIAGYTTGDIDAPVEPERITISVVKIPDDTIVDVQEFWGDSDEIYEKINRTLIAYEAQYPKARTIKSGKLISLSKCPCDCDNEYLTAFLFTKDL